MREIRKGNSANGVLWNAVGSIMFAANSFLLQWLVSVTLDLDEVGKFGSAFATAQMMYIIGNFGISAYQMMDYEHKHKLSDYIIGRVLACMGSLILCAVYLLFSGYGQDKVLLTLVMTLYMLLYSVADAIQCQLFIHGRMDLSGKVLFFRTFASVCAFGGAIIISRSQVLATCVAIAVNVLVSMWAVRLLQQYETISLRGNRECVQSLLRVCVPLCITTLLYSLMNNIAKYVIERAYGDEVLGIYSIVFLPVMVVSLICNFIFKPLYPKIKQLTQQGKEERLAKFLWKIMGFIVVFAVICSALMYVIGTDILSILFGVRLWEYRDLCAIIVLGGGMVTINNLCHYVVVALGMQKAMMYITVAGTLVMSALSIYLIPGFHLYGAAYAYDIGYVVLVAIMVWYIMKIIKDRRKQSERALG